MGRNQFLALCAVAFAGCFVGGFLAQVGPAHAWAQLQRVPPGGQNIPNIRNQDILFIPDGGLRMVTGQNRTLGWIVDQGGNAGIVLMNSAGRASVTLAAGSAGTVLVSGADGPGVKLTDVTGRAGVELSVAKEGGSLKLGERATLTAGNDGGRLLLKNGSDNNAVRVDSTPEGGRVTGFDKGQATKFELSAREAEGALQLTGKDREIGFQAYGSGSASVTKDKETLWKVPKDSAGR